MLMVTTKSETLAVPIDSAMLTVAANSEMLMVTITSKITVKINSEMLMVNKLSLITINSAMLLRFVDNSRSCCIKCR